MKRIELLVLVATLALGGTLAADSPAAVTPQRVRDDKLVLARVNGDSVTAVDLLKLFTDRHSGHAAFLGGENEARSFLNIVIDEELLLQEAFNLGLEEEEAVAAVVREYADTTISNALVTREITEKAKPSSDDLEAARRNLNFVMQVRQVALATRREAEDVRAAILRGEDMEALARTCSGARSSRNGGNVMVSWGQFAPEWEDVVFRLEPGEISPVIETLDGYEVVLCVNRVDIPLPELKDVKDQLEATLVKRRTADREKAFTAELWSRYEARFADIDLSPAALSAAFQTKPDTIVATWNGGSVTLAESFNADELWQLVSLPPLRAKNEIEKRIRMTVNSPLSILEARARRLEEAPENAAKIDEYREYIVKNLLFRDHIFSNIAVKDGELQKYYDGHKEQFEEPPQYHLAQIVLGSEKDAMDIYGKLNAGASFTELVKQSRDPVSGSNGGDLGWVTPDRIPPTFAEILTLSPGAVAKPVVQKNGAWHLVKLLDYKDKRLPPIEEVKEKVREKALDAARRDARSAWIAKLRAASTIEVDAAAITQFVADHASDADAPPPQHAMQ
jgi:parvulin-like peptidyl-prolyl isomerase